jgi:amino acid transporter
LVPPEWISAHSFLHQLPGYVHVTMPWLTFYAAVVKPNPGITWLIGIIFMFGLLNLAHALIYSASRIVLAWVEDRVFPESFGFVHPQLKSPLIAVLMGCIIAVIGIVDGAINGSLLLRLNLVFFWVLSLFLPILSIALLPLMKKDWFRRSPALVQARIGRIPLITILGLALLGYLAVVLVATVTTGFLGGIGWQAVVLFGLLFCGGLGWYYWRRRELLLKGIKLEEVFKTLPHG